MQYKSGSALEKLNLPESLKERLNSSKLSAKSNDSRLSANRKVKGSLPYFHSSAYSLPRVHEASKRNN